MTFTHPIDIDRYVGYLCASGGGLVWARLCTFVRILVFFREKRVGGGRRGGGCGGSCGVIKCISCCGWLVDGLATGRIQDTRNSDWCELAFAHHPPRSRNHFGETQDSISYLTAVSDDMMPASVMSLLACLGTMLLLAVCLLCLIDG